MSRIIQGTREEQMCHVFRHVSYLNSVINDLERASDCRGMVEVDGRLRQAISGRWGLKKEEIEHILRLCDLYGMIKFDPRTKLAKVMK